ncbi:MAG: helix-turn-helix domain-containing protein [Trueperaceae bacterium]
MTSERVVGAWAEFQANSGGLGRPRAEADYEQVIALLGDLTDNYDCTREPYASLFDLLASYADAWEQENEPDLKTPDVDPHEMLAYLMKERGVTQYQLAQDGIVDQGNLSRILAGKRSISKTLAKKLAGYFRVSVEVFV